MITEIEERLREKQVDITTSTTKTVSWKELSLSFGVTCSISLCQQRARNTNPLGRIC